MAHRLRGYQISRPQPIFEPEPPSPPESIPPTKVSKPSEEAPPWPSSATRPLSDIREITEPSLMDLATMKVSAHARPRRSISRAGSIKRKESTTRDGSVQRAGSHRSREVLVQRPQAPCNIYDNASSSSYSATPPDLTGAYAIPRSSVPKRSSSFSRSERPSAAKGHSRKPSLHILPPPPPIPPPPELRIPNHGQSRSPVKEARLRVDPVTSDAARRVPSRTTVRSSQPTDILDFPSYKHPRLKLEVQASAPVAVGGGSVEGFVKIVVDDNERSKPRRTIGFGSLSVDLLGFEDVSGGRRAVFLSLGTELIDAKHPPPANMIEPSNPLTPGDHFWTLSPSTSALPFMISLPLDTGPPPFQSKQASIRFLLCTTAVIRDAGSHYRVRSSQEVQVLPTYDPERALTSLPSPLTAGDELRIPRGGTFEGVKVTAGLHRQVWVSGSTVFVDVHIANKCRKHIKRLDLSLERDILCYKHAAPVTRDQNPGQNRIFESNDQSMVAISRLRRGSHGWNGVDPHSSDTRTCDLELPRGHATVRCGKYFEVRYFLNVTVSLSNTKLVTLQLPIILIHMNSLDVVPNSVAQVAAAIEEKRAQHHHHRQNSSDTRPSTRRGRTASSPSTSRALQRNPSYTQGRAFAAPRQQSLDRRRADKADIDYLRSTLDASPRKHQLHGFALRKMGSTMSFGNLSLSGRSGGGGQDSAFRAIAFRTPEPPKREAEGVDSIRERMRRMRSFDTFRSPLPPSNHLAGFGEWKENVSKPSTSTAHSTLRSGRDDVIDPHALGLGRPVGMEQAVRPAMLSQQEGFRERMDRTRFEIKGVRRRPSGSLRERGMGWWEQVRHRGREREKEMEGWI